MKNNEWNEWNDIQFPMQIIPGMIIRLASGVKLHVKEELWLEDEIELLAYLQQDQHQAIDVQHPVQ